MLPDALQRFFQPGMPAREGPPQPFAVPCACGEVARGRRQSQSQTMVCPRCGQNLFVASRSPLDAPLMPDLAAARPPSVTSDAATTALAGLSQPGRTSPAVPGKRPECHVRETTGGPAEAGLSPPMVGGNADGMVTRSRARIESALAVLVAKWRRRWTLPRLALVGAMICLAATAAWSFRSKARGRYALDLESSTEAGLAALAQGQFIDAAEALERADRAARGLGLETVAARRARQLYRESLVWRHLAPRALEEFFIEEAALRPTERSAMAARFQTRFRGTTLVFAGLLTRHRTFEGPPEPAPALPPRPPGPPSARPSPQVTERVEFDWRWHGEGITVLLDLSELTDVCQGVHAEPRFVVWGASLESLQPDPSDNEKWRVRFQPHSDVLLSAEEPLRWSGWIGDDVLDETLARQSQALGIAP